MSARNATQREVIDRLRVVLRPAQATMAGAEHGGGNGGQTGGGARKAIPRYDVRIGSMQQRYRLYRVCGYGIVSACYYATKSPTW